MMTVVLVNETVAELIHNFWCDGATVAIGMPKELFFTEQPVTCCVFASIAGNAPE
jgi:hypothetical protein